VADDLDTELDRLFGLPAGEFTAARDALARELRGEGRREEADAVKALRRPTAAAAAVNAAVRSSPDGLQALLDAGAALRDAQEALLGGGGSRDALREATEAERAAVRELVSVAGGLEDAPSGAALDRVRETLHAAAADDGVRDAVARGRMVREAEAGGLGFLGGPATEAVAPRRAKRAAKSAPKPPARTKPARSAPAKPARSAPAKPARSVAAKPAPKGAASPEDERAAARTNELRDELKKARTAERNEQKAMKEAERAASRAHHALELARADVSRAQKRENTAREAAQRTLRDLNRAQAIAGEAADRVKALEDELG
jgi:hypothetical protein